jgi:putative aldouronate transport system permease protein
MMALPIILYVVLFTYVPLWGWSIAFQNFKPQKGLFGQEWVGFKWFSMLFSDDAFFQVMRNTLAMSIINLVLGFTTSIGLALLLNEVRTIFLKRFVQTVSYLPHFLSMVIVAGLVQNMLASDGVFNLILLKAGFINEPVQWLGKPEAFWWIAGFTNVWKELGWTTIIYLAAISSIDPHLYEAADIDGCGRFQKMRHITLPSIKPTIVILLIISIGYILESGFEIQYLLGNGMNQEYSQSIDIYVVNYGLGLNNYSLATAAGIFKSVVSVTLLFGANMIAKKFGEDKPL